MAAIPLRYQGLSGKVSYGFRDTYLLDFNIGYTGSENFEKGKRFGFFPPYPVVGCLPNMNSYKKSFLG